MSVVNRDGMQMASLPVEKSSVKSRPPKVLLLVPRLHIGGAERYVASLAENLHIRGYGVVIASQGGKFARMLRQDFGIRRHPVFVRFNTKLAARMVERIVRDEGIDIIHANLAAAGEVAAIVGAKLGVPWVLTAHIPIHQGAQSGGLRLAERVISVSDYLSDHLLAHSGFDPDRLLTITNGVDTSIFRPCGRGAEVRKEWGVGPEDFLIGLSARVHSPNGKGHTDLIRMLSTYSEARDWHVAFIGCGKAEKPLKALAGELGVAARVHFAGHVSDVPSALDALDAAVLPSYAETFGLAVAEAMALEKPVVAYATGGIPELIEDGVTGFLVPTGDVESLARNLDTLRRNSNMAREMGLRGRKRVEEHFSLHGMVDRMEQVYEQVLEGRGSDRTV